MPPTLQELGIDRLSTEDRLARAFLTHSILMTGGELEVRFHSLHFRSVGDVVSPLQWTEAERTWPLVEA